MNNKNSKSFQSSLVSFRRAFTIIIMLNTIFVIERTIFDFMGFMFGMIIADLAYLLFLIIGLFGAYQYRVNYIVMCTLMSLGWIAWNIFVICVYLNIGMLNRYEPIALNLNTGKKSWFLVSSFGCRTELTKELEQLQLSNALRTLIETATATGLSTSPPTTALDSSSLSSSSSPHDLVSIGPGVQINQNSYKHLENFIQANCFMPFYLIEIVHSGVFIFLGIFCVIFGLLLSNAFNEEDDTFDYIGGFDTAHIISANFVAEQQQQQQPQQHSQLSQPITLTRNGGHIRLEPLYA